jgi:hypothetical protein
MLSIVDELIVARYVSQFKASIIHVDFCVDLLFG